MRVLRVARFAARFAFAIAPETLDLMRKMAENGEVDALVPERVWQELARGLMEREPSRLFEVLHECAALPRILPEMEFLYEEPAAAAESMRLLDLAAGEGRKLEVRIAVLARSCDPLAIESLAERIKLPAACRDLALLAARHTNLIVDAQELDAAELLELLDSTDAWRRPERFADLVDAALVGEPHAAAVRARLKAAQRAAATVNAGEIARQAKTPAEIRPRIDGARLAAIRAALDKA